MSLVSSAWIRFCAGTAILLIALGAAALFMTPLIHAIRWW